MTKAPTPAAQTVTELFARWPSVASVARDLGLSHWTVVAWQNRDSIPVIYWEGLVQAARRRSIAGVSYASMRKLAADAKATRRAQHSVVKAIQKTAPSSKPPTISVAAKFVQGAQRTRQTKLS